MAPSAPSMSRRGLLCSAAGWAGVGLLVLRPAAAAEPRRSGVQRASRALLGTRVHILARGAEPQRLAAAVAAAFCDMARLERMMSRFRPDSIVAAMDRGAGRHVVEVPLQMMPVLQAAAQVAEGTGGDFDPTVGAYAGWRFDHEGQALRQVPGAGELKRQRPSVGYQGLALEPKALRARLRHPGMRLDLGGVAKLPILEAGLQTMHQHGMHDALIDGGGDIVASAGPDLPPWRVGLRDPRSPRHLLGVLEFRDGVLAASGDYERAFEVAGQRFHHVLDPRSGQPTSGVRGVFLWSARVAAVNGIGPSVMVAGPHRGLQRLQALSPAVDALLVDADGRLNTVGAMRQRLQPVPAQAAEV